MIGAITPLDIFKFMNNTDTIPPELSEVDSQNLKNLRKDLINMKKKLRRSMDHIDTELLGIMEELRKRKELEKLNL